MACNLDCTGDILVSDIVNNLNQRVCNSGDTMTGDLRIEADLHVTGLASIGHDISTLKSLNVGLNADGNSAIGFGYNGSSLQSAFWYDTHETTPENRFKLDVTSAEEGYIVLHTGNYVDHIKSDFVLKIGDTMTGTLAINHNVPLSFRGHHYLSENTGHGNFVYHHGIDYHTNVATEDGYPVRLIAQNDDMTTHPYIFIVNGTEVRRNAGEDKVLEKYFRFHRDGRLSIYDGDINVEKFFVQSDSSDGDQFVHVSGDHMTGSLYTSGALVAGEGSGGVALTHNDGYGNANVTFNHKNGTPEQNGAAGRITVNTDGTAANAAKMTFGVKSNVTGNSKTSITPVLELDEKFVYGNMSVSGIAENTNGKVLITREYVNEIFNNSLVIPLYVDANNGDDSNDGRTPNKAVKTLKQASKLCLYGPINKIILLSDVSIYNVDTNHNPTMVKFNNKKVRIVSEQVGSTYPYRLKLFTRNGVGSYGGILKAYPIFITNHSDVLISCDTEYTNYENDTTTYPVLFGFVLYSGSNLRFGPKVVNSTNPAHRITIKLHNGKSGVAKINESGVSITRTKFVCEFDRVNNQNESPKGFFKVGTWGGGNRFSYVRDVSGSKSTIVFSNSSEEEFLYDQMCRNVRNVLYSQPENSSTCIPVNTSTNLKNIAQFHGIGAFHEDRFPDEMPPDIPPEPLDDDYLVFGE